MSTTIRELSTKDRAAMVRRIDEVMNRDFDITQESRESFWEPVIASGILRGN